MQAIIPETMGTEKLTDADDDYKDAKIQNPPEIKVGGIVSTYYYHSVTNGL